MTSTGFIVMGSALLTLSESNKILEDENIEETPSSPRLLFPDTADNDENDCVNKLTPRGLLKQSTDDYSWFLDDDDDNYIDRIFFDVKTVRFADKITVHEYVKMSKREWKKRCRKTIQQE